MKTVEVAAALIFCKDKLLCVQRGHNNLSYISEKYEFPGGKIEVNETPSAAVVREIEEELSMVISVKDLYMTVYHNYPDFSIIMHAYVCSTEDETTLHLNEHIDFQWCTLDKLHDLDWAAADIPIVDKLLKEGF